MSRKTQPTGTMVEYIPGEGPGARRRPQAQYLPGWAEAEAHLRQVYTKIPEEVWQDARTFEARRLPEYADNEFTSKVVMLFWDVARGINAYDESDDIDREIQAELERRKHAPPPENTPPPPPADLPPLRPVGDQKRRLFYDLSRASVRFASMADEQVLKIFAGRQSEVPDGEMLRDDHHFIATEARRTYILGSLEPFQVPRFLARSLKMRVIIMQVGGCGAEIVSRGRVMYRIGADDRETGNNLFHGIAHDITPSPCSHGDVWIVTAELALPAAYVVGQSLRRLYRWQPHVSTWFIDGWAERVNRLYGSIASGF